MTTCHSLVRTVAPLAIEGNSQAKLCSDDDDDDFGYTDDPPTIPVTTMIIVDREHARDRKGHTAESATGGSTQNTMAQHGMTARMPNVTIPVNDPRRTSYLQRSSSARRNMLVVETMHL